MSHTKHAKKRNIPKAANSLQDECIRVPKVYDWVTDTLTVTKNVEFSREQLRKIEEAMEDPGRRPLRIVCETPDVPPLFSLHKEKHEHDVFCEQVGEKRDVTVPLNGEFVDAQLVDLLFTTDIDVKVVDRHGCCVTDLDLNASVFESFVLCYPDGTELMCNVSRIFCRIPSGTVLLNTPCPSSFTIEVTFCVDIQVEAEVKLEVLAKFCAPRDNDLVAPEVVDRCPDVEFPPQCPDIFPRENCDCQASGEASGMTGEGASETGETSILVDICPNCSLTNSRFRFTFNDTDTSDGTKDIHFTATSFDPETLDCHDCKGGLRLEISGSGETADGRTLDFNLGLENSRFGDRFRVQLIDEEQGKEVFDTGVVTVNEGEIEIRDCVTFEDLKKKRRP